MPFSSAVPNTGYYNASDECWSLFTEVIGAEFSNAVLFGQVHQLTVDAYAVQHAGGPHPDKSVAVHLSGVYLAIERGIPPASIAPLLQQLATRVHDWPHFDPPSVVWPRTIFDVAMADDHTAAVREWSAGVWAGWGGHHEAIATFVATHLRPVEMQAGKT
jgi:Family of unknown function (DUF5946)